MSAKAKEVRGFDHLILNMEICNVAVFDTAGDVIDDIEQTGWSMLYLAEKCTALRASYCRHTYNGYGDTFT